MNHEATDLDIRSIAETGNLLRMTRPRDTRTEAEVTPRANRLEMIPTENRRKPTRRLPITKTKAGFTRTLLVTNRRRLDHRRMIPEAQTSPFQIKHSPGPETSHREAAPTMITATTDRPKKTGRFTTLMASTASHLVRQKSTMNLRSQQQRSKKEGMTQRLMIKYTTQMSHPGATPPQGTRRAATRRSIVIRPRQSDRTMLRATRSLLVHTGVMTGLETRAWISMMSQPAKYRQVDRVDPSPNRNRKPVAARETLRRLPTNTNVSPILCRGIWSCAGLESKIQSGLVGPWTAEIQMRSQERSCARRMASRFIPRSPTRRGSGVRCLILATFQWLTVKVGLERREEEYQGDHDT